MHKLVKHQPIQKQKRASEKRLMRYLNAFAVKGARAIMKGKLIKFSKTYLVFLLFVLAVNLSMEILLPNPEKEKIIVEHGWTYFVRYQVSAIVMFYAMFNFVGSVIFLFKNYKPIEMGMLSLTAGFVLEFAFMKPDWVQNIYAVKIGGAVIGAVIISALYWFIAWGMPSYIIHNYIFKGKFSSKKAQ